MLIYNSLDKDLLNPARIGASDLTTANVQFYKLIFNAFIQYNKKKVLEIQYLIIDGFVCWF